MFGKKAAKPRPAKRAGNNDLANMVSYLKFLTYML